MKTLNEILNESTERYMKAKALYDRPGNEHEKAAAGAAMDRLKAYAPKPKVEAPKAVQKLPHGFYVHREFSLGKANEASYHGPFIDQHNAEQYKTHLKNNVFGRGVKHTTVHHMAASGIWRDYDNKKEAHKFNNEAEHKFAPKKFREDDDGYGDPRYT